MLYFKHEKGHGKVLGADRVVYFVHFSMIRATGFRSLEDGQLVEFTPQFSTVNAGPCWAANEAVPIPETDAAQPDTRAG